jgi:AraC-like DNA-binding protein
MFITTLALGSIVKGLSRLKIGTNPVSTLLSTRYASSAPWDRIDEAEVRPAFRDVAAAHGEDVFFRAGFSISPSDVPIVGELFLSGGSLLEGWSLNRRYNDLWANTHTAECVASDATSLVVGIVPSGRSPAHHVMQFTFGMMASAVVEHVGGSEIQEIWTVGDGGGLLGDGDTESIPMQRHAPFYALRISRAAMSQRFRTPSPINAMVIEKLVAHLVKDEPGNSPTADAYRYISANIRRADLNVRSFARKQMSSVRTVQRELNTNGTSFEELLERVRRHHAARLLTATDMSVTAIAHELGYQSSKSFARAHLRWTGMSPTAWRAQAEHSTLTDAVS